MTQVKYLGYIINERGVYVDPTKIQVIQDWLAQTTLANFFCRFVLGFAHITCPLSQVTRGSVKEKFFWFELQQKVFFELEHHLYSALVLTLPNLQQLFDIETNASKFYLCNYYLVGAPSGISQ